jgi:hypothetical protein
VSSNSLNLTLASWAGQTFITGTLLTGYLTSFREPHGGRILWAAEAIRTQHTTKAQIGVGRDGPLASRYGLMPNGLRNSSWRSSPGRMGRRRVMMTIPYESTISTFSAPLSDQPEQRPSSP